VIEHLYLINSCKVIITTKFMEANRVAAVKEEVKLREVLTDIIKQTAVISINLNILET